MLLALSILAWTGSSVGATTRLRGEDVIAPLLILALGVALGMCFAGLLVVLHYLRAGKVESLRDSVRLPSYLHAPKFSSSGWEGNFRWIAVRSARPRLVQEALRLQKATSCTWEEGLSAAHHEKLFISPPVAGWLLVFGSRLPELDDVDRCYRFVLDLSRKLGHVQYFAVDRALNHHAWVQAEQGTILRGYAWAGRAVWNQGARTAAELELGVTCFDYTDEPERLLFGGTDLLTANTEKVFRLARRWSVDPTTIDARLLTHHHGIAGEVSRSRME
jgi:hypothetical protein